MTAIVVRGDARGLPLPDDSVDLIVTSPPYYGLRDYQDGGVSLAGQIGNEPHPRDYLTNLLDATAEWMRVLKPEGSIFVNLSDKYANRTRGAWRGSSDGFTWRADSPRYVRPKDLPEKSLMLLPERYRIGCVDELGLIARSVIVWDKPSAMPESVTDRVRRSHEDWVHLTKQPRYFSAVDEIRAPHRAPRRIAGATAFGARDTNIARTSTGAYDGPNPLGALPGSVWEIPTQPLRVPAGLEVDHYAAFPMEWPRRIVLGWSPTNVCSACGEGRRPVVQGSGTGRNNNPDHQVRNGLGMTGGEFYRHRAANPRTILGYACSCPEPTATSMPAVVLDPFGGTGTTALVADVLGRHGISIDRSADYCRIAQWRTQDPRERARALGVKPPEPVAPEQAALFGEAS